MGSWHDNPNEFSPTYVVEALVESAREDIISHVSIFASLIMDADGDNEPDGWNIHILFRLSDFEDEAGFFLQDACTLLLNLVDQPFDKR